MRAPSRSAEKIAAWIRSRPDVVQRGFRSRCGGADAGGGCLFLQRGGLLPQLVPRLENALSLPLQLQIGLERVHILRRIIHQLGEDHRPRGRQRPPRPPQVQRAWMPVTDGFLPGRCLIDGFERQGDFDEFLFHSDWNRSRWKSVACLGLVFANLRIHNGLESGQIQIMRQSSPVFEKYIGRNHAPIQPAMKVADKITGAVQSHRPGQGFPEWGHRDSAPNGFRQS